MTSFAVRNLVQAFLIPVLHSLLNNTDAGVLGLAKPFEGPARPHALIVAPTVEICEQISEKFCHRPQFRVSLIHGRGDSKVQIPGLAKGCDILVATKGRL